MAYHVKTDAFEGPLDLLLTLIEEQKLDITRVSLAHVTDQYLSHMQDREHITLANLADFLSVASKLILIKSKALLPLLELEKDEEEEIKDLEWQLAEYKKFAAAAEDLQNILAQKKNLHVRKPFVGLTVHYTPPVDLTAEDLRGAFRDVLTDIPVFDALEKKAIEDVITLEEKIVHVQNVVRERAETTFSEMTKKSGDRMDVVVSFLALLELVKQKIIFVQQKGLFGDIHLKSTYTKEEKIHN